MGVLSQEKTAKAKWVLVHDDGACADGKLDTPLVDGYCPACGYHPDMQSTCFVFHCPTHDVQLGKDKKCPVCHDHLIQAAIDREFKATYRVAFIFDKSR